MNMSKTMVRVVIGVLVVAVVAVGAVYLFAGGNQKKLTAYFASGVGVYQGTPVKILGIQVGSVTKVTPQADSVKIEMKYDDKYRIPANANAFLIANSLVSDRAVQLAPVYTGGPALPSGGSIPLERTASPAELDDIFSALNRLSVALGPNGANKNGSLSTLIHVGAANLNGNGKELSDTIKNMSQSVQTLANSRTDLFGTVTNLRKFTDALNASDAQVRHFEDQLAQVAGDLADERQDLGAALHNLTVSLHDVANFVNANASKLHTDIVGLRDFTNILVKEKGALQEILAVAPVALSNLTHGYQENTGTLGTRSNLANLSDPSLFPKQICDLLDAAANGALTSGLLGPLLGTQVRDACVNIVTKSNSSGLSGLTANLDPSTAAGGAGR